MRDDYKQEPLSAAAQKTGLSFIQFLILGCIVSGTPYGTEYAVYAFGVEATIISIILLSIFFSLPSALISTELVALMPTNHGQIAWCYRAFDNFKYRIFGSPIADFLGYLNALNLLLYYLFGLPMSVVVFSQYLQTATGELTFGQQYLIMFCAILIGSLLNAFNISIVGNFVNWTICIAMTPFFIGFFWRLPDIEISQWTRECDSYDYAFFFSQMAFMAAGYEALGALGGELNFGANKLIIAYSSAVAISVLLMLVPIIATATFPYSDCTDWYDGYFSVAYGDIWTPLYYCVLMGALFSNFSFIVMSLAIAARVVWAMSQPYILLLEDGTMILQNEIETIAINEQDVDHDMHAQAITYDNLRRIPLAILPKKCGFVWRKTGSPIFGLLLFTIWMMAVCAFMSYKTMMQFVFFPYVFTFFCVLFSFMVMKYYEPNAPRWFEVPFGKFGAWLLCIFSVGIMGFICFIMVFAELSSLLICLGFNVVFVVYYFTGKRYFDKKNQYTPISEKQSDEDSNSGIETTQQESDSLLNHRGS